MSGPPVRELLTNGTAVYRDADTPFGADALHLGAFMNLKRGARLLDLCAGGGVVALAAIDAGFRGPVTALELRDAACALARRAAAENGFSDFEVLCADLRGWTGARKYDAVCCNPPFFAPGSGALGPAPARAAARHQIFCTLDDVARAAAQNLKQGGAFYFCYKPAALADAICTLRVHRLEPKRLRLVGGEHPYLALIEARLDGGVGLAIDTRRV